MSYTRCLLSVLGLARASIPLIVGQTVRLAPTASDPAHLTRSDALEGEHFVLELHGPPGGFVLLAVTDDEAGAAHHDARVENLEVLLDATGRGSLALDGWGLHSEFVLRACIANLHSGPSGVTRCVVSRRRSA